MAANAAGVVHVKVVESCGEEKLVGCLSLQCSYMQLSGTATVGVAARSCGHVKRCNPAAGAGRRLRHAGARSPPPAFHMSSTSADELQPPSVRVWGKEICPIGWD